MTILVTGATGRIGRHVVRAYLADGAAVRALVLPGDPGGTDLEAAGVEVVVGERTDRTALARATEGVAIVNSQPFIDSLLTGDDKSWAQ